MKPRLAHAQKASNAGAIELIVGLMVVPQLWLLSATMNAWLGGDASVLLAGHHRQPGVPGDQSGSVAATRAPGPARRLTSR